jgi:hypothetical protein
MLLVLHHEYFLLNRQIASEALEMLFKKHTPFLSCGSFVLRNLFERIEFEETGEGRKWLSWLTSIELSWITFPNLSKYPPIRGLLNKKPLWSWEDYLEDTDRTKVNRIRRRGNVIAYYDPGNGNLYPDWRPPQADDPSDLASLYPFSDPTADPEEERLEDESVDVNFYSLIESEVTPLFRYEEFLEQYPSRDFPPACDTCPSSKHSTRSPSLTPPNILSETNIPPSDTSQPPSSPPLPA